MNKPVIAKMFRNGGSWALRIPSHMVPDSDTLEIRQREPGVLELRAHRRPLSVRELIEKWNTEPPIDDADDELPERPFTPQRFPELDEEDEV